MNGAPDAIVLEHVTLERRVLHAETQELKHRLLSMLGGRHRHSERKRVLDDVTLRVPAGTKLGIIGPNGSGKSTLLKIICGIYEPTSGTARTSGRIAPLLELGAGFDPNLSVTDNILLYGILLGFHRADILERTERIVDFAELHEFRTYPIRALSSGMTARLGFSIATDVAPDILIIDEILSVGDARFREKARRRLETLWQEHTTVITVSHELDYLRSNCERIVWLLDGAIATDAAPDEAIERYTNSVDESASDLVERLRSLYDSEPATAGPRETPENS